MKKIVIAALCACLFSVPAFAQSYRDLESYKRLPAEYKRALDDNFPVECRARGADLLDFWWPQEPYGGFGVINNETAAERSLDNFSMEVFQNTAEVDAINLVTQIGAGKIRADRQTRMQARKLLSSVGTAAAWRVIWGDYVRLTNPDAKKVYLTCFVETCPTEGGCLTVNYADTKKNFPLVIAPSQNDFAQLLRLIARSSVSKSKIAALRQKFNSEVAMMADRIQELPDTIHLIPLGLPKIKQHRPW